MEGKQSLLLVNNKDQFDKEARESKQELALEIPAAVQPLHKEFEELFLEELSVGLPSMCDV